MNLIFFLLDLKGLHFTAVVAHGFIMLGGGRGVQGITLHYKYEEGGILFLRIVTAISHVNLKETHHPRGLGIWNFHTMDILLVFITHVQFHIVFISKLYLF